MKGETAAYKKNDPARNKIGQGLIMKIYGGEGGIRKLGDISLSLVSTLCFQSRVHFRVHFLIFHDFGELTGHRFGYFFLLGIIKMLVDALDHIRRALAETLHSVLIRYTLGEHQRGVTVTLSVHGEVRQAFSIAELLESLEH